jgi:hypothetical protein
MMAGEAVAVLVDLAAAALVEVALEDLGKQQQIDNFVS